MARQRAYVLGTIVDDTDPKRIRWHLKGVFTSPELAEQCSKTIDDFVRPIWLNELLPLIGERPCLIYFPLSED